MNAVLSQVTQGYICDMLLRKLSEIRKNKIKRGVHFVTGGVILLHSFERYEAGHSTYLIFLIAGLVFLTFAIFHHAIVKRFPILEGVFLSIEAILSFVIFAEYLHAGKKLLPFMYLLAGCVQVFALYLLYSKGKHRQH
jgi:multidrug transporter EmrE-like cation transporter